MTTPSRSAANIVPEAPPTRPTPPGRTTETGGIGVVDGLRRAAGALWIMAGVSCAGLLLFVFVGENINNLGALLEQPALPALVLGGALVAFLIGGLLLARPGPGVVRWSSLAGVAWLIAFGPVVVGTLGGDESGPLVSSSLIAGLGIAGAVVAYGSRMAERRLE